MKRYRSTTRWGVDVMEESATGDFYSVDDVDRAMKAKDALLQKYIQHVGECEGTTFIADVNDHRRSDVKFTDDEIEALKIADLLRPS